MRLLKAFGLAVLTLTIGVAILVLLGICGALIDIHVMGWFGLPTEDGYGFAVIAVITMLVMFTLSFLATD